MTAHQPATRWAFPPPWLATPATRLPARSTQDALKALLESDLRSGHSHVAIRHFTMLHAMGAQLPERVETECQRLVRACAPARLARTRRHVEHWLAMVSREPWSAHA